MERTNRLGRIILICGLLCALTWAAFWPTLQNDFIRYDDADYVTENIHVLSGLSWENVTWAFRSGHASNWHPLTWISHMLDVQLFGLNAHGHHFTGLLLHTVNALLLFLVLRAMTGAMTGAMWRSALVAALFAVHPLHVESVAWVAERKDVLSTFFLMLTLWAYAHFVRQKKDGSWKIENSERRTEPRGRRAQAWFWYGGALLLFALGLMSKPMLVTLPCLLLVLDVWPLQRVQLSTFRSRFPTFRRLLVEKLPFFALAVASSFITFIVQDQAHAVSLGIPLGLRVANAIASYVKYLDKTFWPVNLAIFYPHPDLRYPSFSSQWPPWQIALAALGLAAISVSALLRLKRQPWFATGWFWYVGTLVPVIGIVQVGAQAMADRYSYIPLIGVFICLVWGAAEWATYPRLPKWGWAAGGVIVLAACAALTQKQVRYWRNNLTVWEHALTVTANNPLAHYYVGGELALLGKTDSAISHLRAALSADPAYADAYCSLGYLLGVAGKVDEAAEQYRAALRVNPWHALAHNSLGALLWLQGQRPAALAEYAEALRLDPQCAQAHYGLGVALVAENKPSEAAEHLLTTVRLKPNHADAHEMLGQLYAQEGKLEAALQEFEERLRLRPDAQAHYNLALARVMQHDLKTAAGCYRQALQLKPDWVEPLNDLAWILATAPQAELRQGTEAVRLAEQACQLSGGKEARFWGTLDAAYAEAGRFAEALSTAEKARQLAQAAGETNLVQAAEQRVALYRKQQPYHQPGT